MPGSGQVERMGRIIEELAIRYRRDDSRGEFKPRLPLFTYDGGQRPDTRRAIAHRGFAHGFWGASPDAAEPRKRRDHLYQARSSLAPRGDAAVVHPPTDLAPR